MRTSAQSRVPVQTVGDTWEQYPELKLKALKRMQLYAVRSLCASDSAAASGAAEL